MTRKDYVAIAASIQATRKYFTPDSIEEQAAVDLVAKRIANTMEIDNPRFDRSRFLKACGISAV